MPLHGNIGFIENPDEIISLTIVEDNHSSLPSKIQDLYK